MNPTFVENVSGKKQFYSNFYHSIRLSFLNNLLSHCIKSCPRWPSSHFSLVFIWWENPRRWGILLFPNREVTVCLNCTALICMCRKYLSKILKKAKQKKEKQKAIEQFFLIQLFLFLFIFVFLYLSFFFVFWIILVRDQQIYRKNNIYLIGFIHSSVFGL